MYLSQNKLNNIILVSNILKIKIDLFVDLYGYFLKNSF
jgi:hypothetical protein